MNSHQLLVFGLIVFSQLPKTKQTCPINQYDSDASDTCLSCGCSDDCIGYYDPYHNIYDFECCLPDQLNAGGLCNLCVNPAPGCKVCPNSYF